MRAPRRRRRSLEQDAPYIWGTGPDARTDGADDDRADQEAARRQERRRTAATTLKAKPRTFALLSYDTPDGEYKASWDQFYKDLQATRASPHGRSRQLLPQPRVARRRRAHDRQQAEGDRRDDDHLHRRPDLPDYLTHADDPAGLLPRVGDGAAPCSPTPTCSRRTFDQEQWKHAFGLQLIPAAAAEARSRTRTRCTSGGSARQPPTENSFAIIKGEVELLMDGLQLAGPNLTPETFRDGLLPRAAADSRAERDRHDRHVRRPRLLDGHRLRRPRQRRHPLLGPEAIGPDETGNVGTGMYRLVDGGKPLPAGPVADRRRSSCSTRPARSRIYTGRQTSRPSSCRSSSRVPADAPAAKK